MVHYSFVLLCYNNWGMTKQAVTTLLNSFDSNHQSKGMELIIVDNGSTDETPEGINQIKEKYENQLIKIENLRLDQNMGYTPGINAGLAKCQGKIISILSNDLSFPLNWFNGLVEVLESDKEIGLAAPYLSMSSGVQNVNKQFSTLDEMNAFAANFMKENETNIFFTHRIIGACMVFKEEVIQLTGGNDIWFGLGQFDDDDWCLRTMVAGYKIAVVGKSFVHHLSAATYNQQSALLNATFFTNQGKMQRKWRNKELSDILKTTQYSREHHFFPTKKEDFNRLSSLDFQQKGKESRKLLLVADWTHPFSKWKETLRTALEECGDSDEIYLWIPKQYYLLPEILDEIKTKISPFSLGSLNILYHTVSPSDYLLFISFFDAIYSVNDDFINRYMVSLAEIPSL
ncbi:putative glycosyl transferase [Mycobacteroides abscessus subsp. abscessus]|nr:putative glycosyl transferase [Mycobacteroides abscessus subsp. abscessus]